MTRIERTLTENIDALLPQTQCTQCGFSGCLPYAQALADGRAQINQCPPGGQAGVDRLASLLGQKSMPLDPAFGREKALEVVAIDEEHCIGCTLCIQACPVDAIVGAPKQMHTVLTELCTGCLLCVAPCPVDCIRSEMADVEWDQGRADAARERFKARGARLEGEQLRRRQRLADERTGSLRRQWDSAETAAEHKRATIANAVARARAKQEGRTL